MRDLTSFVVFFVVVVGMVMSKPLWSTLTAGNNYLYPASEIDAQPQYLTAYQNAHTPYYIYNVHTNVGDIPSTILASGKPEIPHIPAYSLYYGTPIYDFRIPLNPVYPVLTAPHPGLPPRPIFPPTSTQHPFDEGGDDGIEKLDSKLDPSTGTKKPGSNEQDDDSIIVEAI